MWMARLGTIGLGGGGGSCRPTHRHVAPPAPLAALAALVAELPLVVLEPLWGEVLVAWALVIPVVLLARVVPFVLLDHKTCVTFLLGDGLGHHFFVVPNVTEDLFDTVSSQELKTFHVPFVVEAG